jgi:hypothetical protein
MNYRVDWTEEAEQKLAAVWTASDHRAGVTAPHGGSNSGSC